MGVLAKCSLTTLFVGLFFNKSALTYDMYPYVASNPDDLTMTCVHFLEKKTLPGNMQAAIMLLYKTKLEKQIRSQRNFYETRLGEGDLRKRERGNGPYNVVTRDSASV